MLSILQPPFGCSYFILPSKAKKGRERDRMEKMMEMVPITFTEGLRVRLQGVKYNYEKQTSIIFTLNLIIIIFKTLFSPYK